MIRTVWRCWAGCGFSIEKGDICVLLGPSGSGEAPYTVKNIIGGIDDADAGYISIGGELMYEPI